MLKRIRSSSKCQSDSQACVLAVLASHTTRKNNLQLDSSQMSAVGLKLTQGLSHPSILESMQEVSVCMYLANIKGQGTWIPPAENITKPSLHSWQGPQRLSQRKVVIDTLAEALQPPNSNISYIQLGNKHHFKLHISSCSLWYQPICSPHPCPQRLSIFWVIQYSGVFCGVKL